MQFPCTCHPSYTPSIVDRSGTDSGLQSDRDETGLLQLGTLRRSVSSIQKLQRVQNNAARIVFQELRRSHAKPLMRHLHWLPVQHRIDYKVHVLTCKTLYMSVPQYLSQRINRRVNARTLRSTATPLLIQLFARTDFAKRSMGGAVCLEFTSTPLKLRPYGALQICFLLLLILT